MSDRIRITGDAVVAMLKKHGLACTAQSIAAALGTTDTRAIATAARKPVKDGRITIAYHRKTQKSTYRFVRVKAKAVTP